MNWIEIDESVRTAGRIIVGSGDHLVHIYDLETREELQTLKGHDNFIHGSVFIDPSRIILIFDQSFAHFF